MAEDTHIPPLPPRAPDEKRHVPGGKPEWGSGLTQPLMLPESLQQRIRAALDYADDEAPAPGDGAVPAERGAPPAEQDAPSPEAEAPQEAGAPPERPTSLPRRVPGANNGREPPAHIARPAMLASLVHPRPAEIVAAVPAATLGAIAAAAGISSGAAAQPEVIAQPEAAARPEAVALAETTARPGPAIAAPAQPPLVPAQRPSAEQQPDRHNRRDGTANGAQPPAPPPTPVTRVAMWAYLEQAEAPTGPLPIVAAARSSGMAEKTGEQTDVAAAPGPATVPVPEPQAVPAPRVPAEQRPGLPDQRGEKAADPEQETASRDEVPSQQKSEQASLGKAQLHGANGLARRPGESPPWAPVPPPTAAPRKFAPPKSMSPQPAPALAPPSMPAAPSPPVPTPPPPALPPGRPGRHHRVIGAVILLLLAAAVFLLYRHGNPGKAIAPTTAPTTGASTPAGPSTEAEVRAAAAAWVASQVSRAGPISCDREMCQALRSDGVPGADLQVLKTGGGEPLRSSVIVVTAAVTKMVGTEFLTADAPAAIASFGSGSRQISVRLIYPRGAAAYAAALRQDIAERKATEATLLENPRVTASPAVRQQLQEGQVDPRLLLTLAQLASQWPLSIVAFGDRALGASPGVPLRSADLAVTGDAAGQAQQMSAFAHGLKVFFTSARIRAVRLANGQDVVQVEFAAPSPLGVLKR